MAQVDERVADDGHAPRKERTFHHIPHSTRQSFHCNLQQITVELHVYCRMPGFSKLQLKCPEHPPELLRQFNTLRKDEALCDCILSVGNKEFPVHRSFLAACSSYFCALFTSKMKESTSPLVTIGGVSEEMFELLLDFMYTGEITLTEENITDVFPAAELFQLELLQGLCSDYFLNQLCPSNCIGIWKYAQNYGSANLERVAWCYITSHFMDLISTEEFQSLSKDELCKILSSGELDVNCEMDVYNAAMTWALHDVERREHELVDILMYVRFPLLSAESLSSLSTTSQLISIDKSYKEVLVQAKNAQRLRSTKSRQRKIAAFREDSLTPRKGTRALAVVGGYSGDFVECCEVCDELSSLWQVNSDIKLSSCKHFHWIGVVGLRLYALGGDSISSINKVMSTFTSHAAKLLQTSALSKGWECEAVLPHDCSGMQVCTMNECIYTCGECTVDNVTVYGISCYDISSGTWNFLSSFSHTRVLAGFTSYSGKLYLVGGLDPNSGAILVSFESYDPLTNTWEVLPSCSIARYHAGTGILNNDLYFIGGIGDAGGEINTNLKAVECYSFKTEKWTIAASLSEPRAGMAVCAWRRRVFVIGGETPNSLHSETVETFNPDTGEWSPAPSLQNARIYPTAIVV